MATAAPQQPPSSGLSDEKRPNNHPTPVRRASLGFLRRSKSTEPLSERMLATSKVSRTLKKRQSKDEEARRLHAAKEPPRLPAWDQAIMSTSFPSPPPPIPSTAATITSRLDPYAQDDSIMLRGRHGAANSANGPRRLRRRKDPTPYK